MVATPIIVDYYLNLFRMKTLKITLALVAVALLTVSGVQSDSTVVENETNIKENSVSIDLLAHNKTKLRKPTRG